jgi:hypothetical protein
MIGATVGVVLALGMLVWQGRRRARRARPGPTATRLVRVVVRSDACGLPCVRALGVGGPGWAAQSKSKSVAHVQHRSTGLRK